MDSLSLRAEAIGTPTAVVSLLCKSIYSYTPCGPLHAGVEMCPHSSRGGEKKSPSNFFLGYCWHMDILPCLISSLVPVELFGLVQ